MNRRSVVSDAVVGVTGVGFERKVRWNVITDCMVVGVIHIGGGVGGAYMIIGCRGVGVTGVGVGVMSGGDMTVVCWCIEVTGEGVGGGDGQGQ